MDQESRMLILYWFFVLFLAHGLGSMCATDMDQESKMLILYWFLYCFLHTDWDDESDAKPKMLILYWFFDCFCVACIGYETENIDFILVFALFLHPAGGRPAAVG